MDKRIYLSPPHLTDEALLYLQDAVQSNWIAPVGPHIEAFEAELASVLNVPHVALTNSGTSAIHLGLLALGVGPGDEVFCSTLTYCASVNPVIYCGASPVFIDSEKEAWNMDPVLLEEAVLDRLKKSGKLPKAIIVVHLYGMPARMKEMMEISRKYTIPVLEDAAEALGTLYEGKQAGTWGDIGILSFNGNKIITTSGGGALFSSNEKIIDKARYLRQEAKEPLPYYEHRAVGYNYRISNLLASLGRSQLKVLDNRVKRKREIFDFYVQELGSITGISFQEELPGMFSNRWLTAILICDAKREPEAVRLALEAKNIESRRAWKPMHLQPIYAEYPVYTKGVAEDIFNHGLCLPSGTGMSEKEQDRIVKMIEQVFA